MARNRSPQRNDDGAGAGTELESLSTASPSVENGTDPEPAPAAPGSIDIPALDTTGHTGGIPMPPEPAPDEEPAPAAPQSPETGLEGARSDEPGTRRRRSGGRRKKAEPVAQAAPVVSPEEKETLSKALGAAFAGAARIAASRRGAHWALSADERKEIGDAWAEALAPYLGALTKHAPLIAAGLVTYQIIDQRMQLDNMRQVIPAPPAGREGVEVGRIN